MRSCLAWLGPFRRREERRVKRDGKDTRKEPEVGGAPKEKPNKVGKEDGRERRPRDDGERRERRTRVGENNIERRPRVGEDKTERRPRVGELEDKRDRKYRAGEDKRERRARPDGDRRKKIPQGNVEKKPQGNLDVKGIRNNEFGDIKNPIGEAAGTRTRLVPCVSRPYRALLTVHRKPIPARRVPSPKQRVRSPLRSIGSPRPGGRILSSAEASRNSDTEHRHRHHRAHPPTDPCDHCAKKQRRRDERAASESMAARLEKAERPLNSGQVRELLKKLEQAERMERERIERANQMDRARLEKQTGSSRLVPPSRLRCFFAQWSQGSVGGWAR